VLTGLVLAEACYLVERIGGSPAEAALLRSLSSPRYQSTSAGRPSWSSGTPISRSVVRTPRWSSSASG
jgi:hypothetical protein